MRGLMLWSGGKDSAIALHKARNQGIEVTHTLSFVYKHKDLHPDEYVIYSSGLTKSLIQKQVKLINCEPLFLELQSVYDFTNDILNSLLQEYIKKYNFTHYISGEGACAQMSLWHKQIAETNGMIGVLPNSHNSKYELFEARQIIDAGFKNIVVAIDDRFYDSSYAGKQYDQNLINDFLHIKNKQNYYTSPVSAGSEFHTFCYDGPIFKNRLNWDHLETKSVYTPFHDSNLNKVDLINHFYLISS
jgi:uncharacterized protein (TIGR00290 family)